METHLSAGDGHLNLTTDSRDNPAKLLNHAVQETQSVVLGEGVEEVLEGGTAGTGVLDELGHDGRSVGGGQSRGGEDGNQLGVLLDDGAQLGELLGGGIEGGSLGGRGVLEIDARVSHFRGGIFLALPILSRRLQHWHISNKMTQLATLPFRNIGGKSSSQEAFRTRAVA